ncbi:hypothetical protein E7744_03625 [Citricoccus sp. SGAir0253]|uniref:nucleotide-binding protein n=1 Tax=Citricoccus sp. SGAir0253 TaxID=2567881 RepID=UPI0011076AA3|nr:hypothetical protein [Citricoccus sp. SGAir0253]QCU77406.1 hypothetical protein E7744_03625 [Citricoccus sp. SGAir0253]
MTTTPDPWADAGPAPERPRPGAGQDWSTRRQARERTARDQDDPLAGFEPVAPRTARRHARRHALSLPERAARGLGSLLRHDPTPERLAAHAAAVQAPVTTGRRIAVVSLRGGAGKTTVSALLARTVAALRPEPVAAVDLDPAAGSLGLRLGDAAAPGADRLAAELAALPVPALADLSARMAVSGAGLHHTGPRVAARPLGVEAATTLLAALSRHVPVTVLDCPTGTGHPDTAAVLAHSHAAVFVLPASPAGVDEAAGYLRHWRQDPVLSAVPVTAAVVGTDARGVLDPRAQAAALARVGVAAVAVRHDRHLAAGVDVSLPLARPENRLAAAELSARALAGSRP